MPFFVYQTPTHIQIEAKPIRNFGELLRTFQDLLACRKWVKKTYPTIRIKDDVRIRRKAVYSRLCRRHMSQKKRGKNHHFYGKHLSEEHRAKTSKTMTGTRVGENNPNYGRKHSARTRLKMSISHRKGIRKNPHKMCVDPMGKTRWWYIRDPLPEGWRWGTNYDRRGNW
jgi:hypothetical protein